jgi:hypothetical protein
MSNQNNEQHRVPARESTEMLPQDSSLDRSAAGRVAGAWDPYDVWLTRVKQPREQQPRRVVVVPPVVVGDVPKPAVDPDGDESMLLPGVS